ncbi:MAG: hypothetical protein V4677_16415 [Bacteroidota bacterium]
MKNKLKRIIFTLSILCLSIICSSSYYHTKKGGCEKESLMIEATNKLKKYTLIQDFPFYIKKKKKSGEIEYKKQIITLNRGVNYKFYTIRNTDYDGMPILSIYNNEKQEFLLGTTYNTTLKKFYSEIDFECKTTGNYCLSLCFQDGLEGCAVGVFASMIKQQ